MDKIKQQSDAVFTSEFYEMCKKGAEKYNAIPDIHPDDFMFHFILNSPDFPSTKNAVDYYFDDGNKSAKKLSELLYSNLKFQKREKLKLLEFASGYGCVTRHLLRELPNVTIVSCDIHQKAINFIKKQLKTDATLSKSIPEELRLNAEYDVIFALSFFSHMPETSWGRWVKALFSGLKENGFLIFTTHGLATVKLMGNTIDIPSNGFWFAPNSEQRDIDTEEYGSTVVTPDYVIEEIYQQTHAPLVLYRHAFWWTHQDLYVIKKGSGAEIH